MYEFHPYFTNDGSIGLYNSDYDDIYHSAGGALTEAYEKFVYPVNYEKLLQKKSMKVLDICYGIGYNSKSFLNFLLEKYFSTKIIFKFSKNFSKKNTSYRYHIDSIYTNKIFNPKSISNDSIYTDNILLNTNNLLDKNINSTCCSETIYTNNITPNNNKFLHGFNIENIFIKTIDNDKILTYLSPFVKTGVKKISNKDLNFEYKKIDKFLLEENRPETKKINPLINLLIMQEIIKSKPEIFENKTFLQILDSPSNTKFFDQNMKSIFNFYRQNIYKSSTSDDNNLSLHNIYYRYISKCYKNGRKVYNLPDINLELKNDDARKIITEDVNKYDLIFLDAFTPSKCPCLWSFEFFKALYEHLEDDGIILTYSSAATVRSAMFENGFEIGYIFNERENKFTGTIASKNKSMIKHPLSEYDLGLLKTTAGIFYRDKNLTGQNEAIIAARNFDVKNSKRMTSSHYQKIHNKEEI